MNKELSKFVDEYIALCGQLCQKAEDYTRENVATHNRAVKKLNSLKERAHADLNFAEKMYHALLTHNDMYVRQDAATECLFLDIHVATSLEILKKISRGKERMAAMGAKRTLLIWKGKLNPNDPF